MKKIITYQELDLQEQSKYHRQILIPEIGLEGQKKLKNSSVLIVGIGGLGSPLALYLAAAGIGKLGLVDHDIVEETNLHRQILYNEKDIGKMKVQVAQKKLQLMNHHLEIKSYPIKLTPENALKLFKDYDVIADGTDNFLSKYLINDACVLLNKVDVYASIYQCEGKISVFNYHNGPCYRCIYPEPPSAGLFQNSTESGILGVLPGIIGCLQAAEIIKILLQLGNPLSGKLLHYNALTQTFKILTIRKNMNCLHEKGMGGDGVSGRRGIGKTGKR